MRETKFRGKATRDYPSLKIRKGDWVYGYLVDKYLISVDIYMDDYGDLHCVLVEVDPKTVGQYTTIDDKNGKEIYDGDIVQDQDGNLYQVKYTKYYIYPFGAIFPDKPKEVVNEYECEVIGNVYDEPLKNGGKKL